jgi:hypothetical protein
MLYSRAVCSLRLLGRLELSRGTRPLHVSPSGERLLAYLGIRSEPVSRGSAAAELWPACTGTRAAANLRSAVWRLPGHDQGGLIAAAPQHLALDARVSVDLHDLSRQVGPGSAARHPGQDVDVDVLRQDVLPEWPDEWLIGTRECSGRSGCTRWRRYATAIVTTAASTPRWTPGSPPSPPTRCARAPTGS